jgi:hypothetical protein
VAGAQQPASHSLPISQMQVPLLMSASMQTPPPAAVGRQQGALTGQRELSAQVCRHCGTPLRVWQVCSLLQQAPLQSEVRHDPAPLVVAPDAEADDVPPLGPAVVPFAPTVVAAWPVLAPAEVAAPVLELAAELPVELTVALAELAAAAVLPGPLPPCGVKHSPTAAEQTSPEQHATAAGQLAASGRQAAPVVPLDAALVQAASPARDRLLRRLFKAHAPAIVKGNARDRSASLGRRARRLLSPRSQMAWTQKVDPPFASALS